MMKTAAVLLLLCAAASVQAQSKPASDKKDAPAAKVTDVGAALKEHPLALALLNAAGVTKPASNPKARFTFLMPTEAALAAFLKDMGLTAEDLKKRPVLAKQLVRQHLILRSNVREQEIFEKGNTRAAATTASVTGNPDVVFARTAPGKVTVTDAQGGVANVNPKPIFLDENKTVHMIDRVLAGDDYYTSFAALCKHRASKISSFCDAVKAAGLTDALTAKGGLDATVFVPNNEAFKVATAKGAPSTEALAAILKYHVVPGARELARDWKAGTALPTLAGKDQDLKIEYTKVKPVKGPLRYPYAEAKVVPADGKGVPVLKANVHVGKTIVQGIGAVLLPGDAAKAAAGTAPEAGAKKVAAAAAAEKPKASSAAGRKLLQGWQWGMSGGPTAEMDDAESAIDNAVAGNESVASAADQSLLGAEELSVPGDYNQVVNGVNPW